MLESARIIEDTMISKMVENDYIFVIKMAPPYEGNIYLARREDYDAEYGDLQDTLGVVTLGSTTDEETMAVANANVAGFLRKKGYGKLLYNVALMACSDEWMWMMADRNNVSSDAQRVWEAWKQLPDLYEIEQMDHVMIDDESFLTDDEDDDMIQNSFNDDQFRWSSIDGVNAGGFKQDSQSDSWYFGEPAYREAFLNSGLTKRFMMKDTDSFREKLESNDLIYYQHGG